jgi:hypothetical protein
MCILHKGVKIDVLWHSAQVAELVQYKIELKHVKMLPGRPTHGESAPSTVQGTQGRRRFQCGLIDFETHGLLAHMLLCLRGMRSSDHFAFALVGSCLPSTDTGTLG